METSAKQTCEDLVALVNSVRANFDALAEQHGLTHVQLYAMNCINGASVTMGTVASGLHCDASNVTGVIDRLVAQGLVTRKESEQDRRAKLLHLTDKGRQILEEIYEEMPTVLGCSKLSTTERSALHSLISRLI